MNHYQAPLFQKLKDMSLQKRASFHVPGHKFGQGLDEEEQAYFQNMMAIDYTEITGLDDLHQPRGVILEAQQLAADCFGADHTFFLVNGSTAGNLALILACCNRDDIIIVQRDMHKSILHGLMLAGARAVFISPMFDHRTGLATGVDAHELEATLQRFPQAKAVMLTNPNYYGRGIILHEIAELVHAYHMPLLVDEAHGAHFGFHPDLPLSALASGADGVVQSTHKMLQAMTMGAMLHIQGNRIDIDAVQHKLSMVQSSSPSYPIMASLDISRRFVATKGLERLSCGIAAVARFKYELQALPWFKIAEQDTRPMATQDPFKVAIQDCTATLNGYRLQQALEDHECMVEMADPNYVLLSFSLFSTSEDVDVIMHALQNISEKFQLQKQELGMGISNNFILPPLAQNVTPVEFGLVSQRDIGRKLVTLRDAIEERSASMIIPYPPGIPLLMPGEEITVDMVQYLERLIALGAVFQGEPHIYDQKLQIICEGQ